MNTQYTPVTPEQYESLEYLAAGWQATPWALSDFYPKTDILEPKTIGVWVGRRKPNMPGTMFIAILPDGSRHS